MHKYVYFELNVTCHFAKYDRTKILCFQLTNKRLWNFSSVFFHTIMYSNSSSSMFSPLNYPKIWWIIDNRTLFEIK